MNKKKIATGLFLAALSALILWAAVAGCLRLFLSGSSSLFGKDASAPPERVSDDVLFDRNENDLSSDSLNLPPDTPVGDNFDPSRPAVSEGEAGGYYEFAMTPEYFNALLRKYEENLPIKSPAASFSGGEMILSGDADVSSISSMLNIPAALVVFLPKTVPCKLSCVPVVRDGKLLVTVTSAWAGSDILSPYLSREGVLSSVEEFLNLQLTKYLPSEYIMESASVSDGGIYVRFRIS